MSMERTQPLLGIAHQHLGAGGGHDGPGIAHLSARLAIEGGLVDQDLHFVAG
jgi:hypothetical protein